jgi:2-keto-4-pentenoate hydratase/2-oxohepta-3-ene-1,7-dioic acid hydratase in catechol pathway
MINNPARLVSYLSRYMTLEPGDLIYTGAISPEPGMRSNLQVGDRVTVQVEGLGSMEQQVVAMPAWPH